MYTISIQTLNYLNQTLRNFIDYDEFNYEVKFGWFQNDLKYYLQKEDIETKIKVN